MKNNASDEFYHIGRAAQMLDEIYDIEVDIRKVREAATRVVNNCSPIRSRSYILRTCIRNFKVTLPCDIPTISSVTKRNVVDNWLSSQRGSNILFREFDFMNQTIETVIGDPQNPNGFQTLRDFEPIFETEKEFLLELPSDIPALNTPHAFFEDYSLQKNVLSFNRQDGYVDIIYSTVTTDEHGFPLLTEKGIWAVVHWLVYLDQVKRFYKKEGNENAVAHALSQYERSAAQAKSPTSITDNQRNEIMKALLSKSRHQYGNPYKG